MPLTLTLDDDVQILALRRMLLESKFALEPDDEVIAGSPIVADIIRRVFASPTGSESEIPRACDFYKIVEVARLRMAEVGSEPD